MTTNLIFGIALAVGVLAVLMTLRQHHRDRRAGTFSVDDLLVDPKTNTTSPSRCMLVGVFLVSSVVVLYQMYTHALTDLSFGAYLTAFAAPAVAKIVTDNGVEKAAATTTPTTVDNSTNVDVNAAPKTDPATQAQIAASTPKTRKP